jgi:ATP-dependent Clp protease ATP-binding subunit ClpB
MTSNLGSQYIAERAMREGTIDEGTRREVLDAMRQHFRPEFINRIDEVIVFHPLGREHMGRIIDLQMARLLARLEERKITLHLSDAARQALIEEGYDPLYGARPLKRTLQRRVLDPLAMAVLQGEFREGDEVSLDVVDGALTFEKRQAVVH